MIAFDNAESLLIYGFYVDNPGADNPRQLFIAYLICWVLYRAGKPLSVNEIGEQMRELASGASIPQDLVVSNAKLLHSTKSLERVDKSLYKLSDRRLGLLKKKVKEYETAKAAFSKHITDHLDEIIKLEEVQKQAVIKKVTEIMVMSFQSLEQAFNKSKTQQEGFLEIEIPETGVTSNLHHLEKIDGLEKSDIEDIKMGVVTALGTMPTEALAFIADIHHKVFMGYFLNQDPRLWNEQRALLGQRRLYLDTNVVLAYFLSSHEAHDLVEAALKRSLALGMKLRVTGWTVDELKRQVASAGRYGPGLLGSPEAVEALRSGRLPILEDFWAMKKLSYNLEWDVYFSRFGDIETFLADHKIDIAKERQIREVEELAASTPLDENYQLIRKYVRQAKEDQKRVSGREEEIDSPDVIEHDAKHVVLIQELRGEFKSDALGSRVWFITLDRGLCRSQEFFKHLFARPGVRNVAKWAEFLVPFAYAEIDSEVTPESYIGGLIKADLMIHGEEFLDPHLYEALWSSGLPIDILLKEQPKYIEKMLAEFQAKKEVQELLQTLQAGEDGEAKGKLREQMVETFRDKTALEDQVQKARILTSEMVQERETFKERAAEEEKARRASDEEAARLKQRLRVAIIGLAILSIIVVTLLAIVIYQTIR